MNEVTPETAYETYKRTVRDEPRAMWANWVKAVYNSLAAGYWLGGDHYPDFAEEVFKMAVADKKISMADSN